MQNINNYFLRSQNFNTVSNISSSKGGVKHFKIPGLVVENISKDLADKLLAKSLKPVTKSMTFYIKQDIGDDSIADGSQDKPFKSILRCYNYIRDNFYFSGVIKTLASQAIVIKFLSDYTETENVLEFFGITNDQMITQRYAVEINGEGFDVILNCVINYRSYLIFKNIVFKGSNATADSIIYSIYGRTFVGDSTIKTDNNCTSSVILRASSYGVLIPSTTISFNVKHIPQYFMLCDYLSMITTANMCQFNFENNFKISEAFIKCSRQSLVEFEQSSNFNLNSFSVTGRKYFIDANGFVNTRGRGKDFILGSIEGILQTQGQLV